MTQLTFIIPIGLKHRELSSRAIDSVIKQSVKCSYLGLVDKNNEGPAKLRNEMLRQVKTPFVSFLDADDWLEPTFAEDTLAEYERIQRSKYIYVDWFAKDRVIETPCLTVNGQPISALDLPAYCGGTWHPITALIPLEWVFAVGGFDETLPADEDTDFYLKLCTTSHCGHRLAKPLFHYSPNGGRSLNYYQGENFKAVKDLLSTRYKGRKTVCCGDDSIPLPPIGSRLDGDVQAMALWQGNHTTQGKATGRIYSYMSYPKTTWISPLDIRAAPHEWKEVTVAVDQGVGSKSLEQLANIGMTGVKVRTTPDYSVPKNEPEPPPITGKPDVARLLAMAKNTQEPIFVFPEKDYESYADIKRLVELSGFKAVTFKKVNVFSRQPLIIVSPEEPPNFEGVPSRIIYWQLEYAGDYVRNYDNAHGELWASDPTWAAQHGAKFVPLGSHPGLATHSRILGDKTYDLTMLAYLTPRRQMLKNRLKDLTWPTEYPGHGDLRNIHLADTWLMLHVHQHEQSPFFAPQRLAIAAANKMAVFHEAVTDTSIFNNAVAFMQYDEMQHTILNAFGRQWGQAQRGFVTLGERLYKLLCEENTFRKCVEEGLKS